MLSNLSFIFFTIFTSFVAISKMFAFCFKKILNYNIVPLRSTFSFEKSLKKTENKNKKKGANAPNLKI